MPEDPTVYDEFVLDDKTTPGKDFSDWLAGFDAGWNRGARDVLNALNKTLTETPVSMSKDDAARACYWVAGQLGIF